MRVCVRGESLLGDCICERKTVSRIPFTLKKVLRVSVGKGGTLYPLKLLNISVMCVLLERRNEECMCACVCVERHTQQHTKHTETLLLTCYDLYILPFIPRVPYSTRAYPPRARTINLETIHPHAPGILRQTIHPPPGAKFFRRELSMLTAKAFLFTGEF
jgi:hypothetical protein